MEIVKKLISLGDVVKPNLVAVQTVLKRNCKTKPCFDDESLKAVIYIFQCVLMDRMVELYEKEEMPEEFRLDMALKCGQEVRAMVKTYCDVDSFEL